jgi:hypothetical protein
MSTRPAPPATAQPVRLKAVALPVEHGGWGMLGEPLVLGLLVAPSWPGLFVGCAAVCAFLARHPLKLAVSDRVQGRTTPRTHVAWVFAGLYAAGAAAFLAAALPLAPTRDWWWPLLAAAPLALTQLVHDVRREGRQLLPELVGGMALGSVAAAELRAAGWSLGVSLAAWALVAAKALGAVLYVRTRLRRARGLTAARGPALLAHGLAAGAAASLAAHGLGPWLAVVAFALLLARAAHGLSARQLPARPQAVGWAELRYGFGFVLLLALGYVRGAFS